MDGLSFLLQVSATRGLSSPRVRGSGPLLGVGVGVETIRSPPVSSNFLRVLWGIDVPLRPPLLPAS